MAGHSGARDSASRNPCVTADRSRNVKVWIPGSAFGRPRNDAGRVCQPPPNPGGAPATARRRRRSARDRTAAPSSLARAGCRNQARPSPAATAQAQSDERGERHRNRAHDRRAAAPPAALGSMNCGRNAVKNAMVLGFDIATTTPRPKLTPLGGGLTAAVAGARATPECRARSDRRRPPSAAPRTAAPRSPAPSSGRARCRRSAAHCRSSCRPP